MGYMAGNPLLMQVRSITEGIATSGQTTIPIPGGFVPGMNDVYVAGAKQPLSAFNDTSGTQIVLNTGMTTGQTYSVSCWSPATSANNNINLCLKLDGSNQMAGNIVFSQVGARIMADMSNGTLTNRFFFQNSVANSSTVISTMPSGTGAQSNFNCYSGSDPNNASLVQIVAVPGSGRLASASLGSQGPTDLELWTAGVVRYVIDASGNHVFSGTSVTCTPAATFKAAICNSQAAGNYRGLWYQTNGTNRIGLGCNATAESGSNTGSDFSLDLYNDAGTWVKTALSIARSNGYTTVNGTFQVSGPAVLYQNSSLSPPLTLQAGTYTPAFRSNSANPGFEWINGANNAALMQLSEVSSGAAGTLNVQQASFGVLGGKYNNNKIQVYYYGPSFGNGISFVPQADNATACLFFNAASTVVGSITTSSTATAFNVSSDYRLKQNVATLAGGLDRIMQLHPVSFEWISTGQASRGFLAHELQVIEPDAVTGEKDGMTRDVDGNPIPEYQGVDKSFLIPDLVAAIQDLKGQLDAALARIATLEAGGQCG